MAAFVTRIPLPFSVELLPTPVYLVGGAVRDWVHQHYGGRKQPEGKTSTGKLDLDLVVLDHAIEQGSRLAKMLGGGFVVLDADREIARIVLKSTTIDIAKQMGPTVETDLYSRDFTCNAIALELHTDTWLDPLNGIHDITAQTIRMIHPDNLSADPLRLLRAYRQAAQLGFSLDPVTREAIRQRTDLLTQVAGERVRTELHTLILAGSSGLNWIENAWHDNLLNDWIPYLTPTGFTTAHRLHTLAPRLQTTYPATFEQLEDPITDQRTLKSVITLAGLLFPHSQPVDVSLEALKYSRAERQLIQKLHTLLPYYHSILSGSSTSLRATDYYIVFRDVGSLFPALALLTLATGVPVEIVQPWLDHFEDPQDALAHPVPLVDGKQIMQALNLKPGPIVGQLLKAVGLAQAEGVVTTSSEALTYAQQQLQTLN